MKFPKEAFENIRNKAQKILQRILIEKNIPKLTEMRTELSDKRLEIMSRIESIDVGTERDRLLKEYKLLGDGITEIDNLVDELKTKCKSLERESDEK